MKYLIVLVRRALPSSCRLIMSPVAVVVPPVTLLPLAVAVLTPVTVVMPHVAVLLRTEYFGTYFSYMSRSIMINHDPLNFIE